MMQAYWDEIERLFKSKLPRGYRRYFGPGASDEALIALEGHIGFTLPDDFKAFYRVHDGQGRGDPGMWFGLDLLPVRHIRRAWDDWATLGDEHNDEFAAYMRSEPDGFIRKLYLNRGWIPFTSDQAGNHIGLDLDPDQQGIIGQVIIFGRDENKKKVFARSFRDGIHLFVEQLRTIEWRIDLGDGWVIRHDCLGKRFYHDCFEGALRAPTEE